MPTYEMQAPDGNKYRIDGPPGASDDQVRQQILQQHPNAGQKPASPEPVTQEKWDVGMGQILPSVGRAASNLLPSVGRGLGDIWHAVTHYDEVYAALKEKKFSDIASAIGDDLKEHYGSLERAKRTFETDPFKFVTDMSIPLSGGAGVTKLGLRIGREILPEVAATARAPAAALRTAGEAGALGGPEAAEYRAGVAGRPSPIAAASQGAPASQAMAAQQAMAPFGQAGQDIRSAGFIPPLNVKTAVKALAGKEIGMPLWAAPLLSPRIAGRTMFELGRGERMIPTPSRAALISAASGLLQDRDAKRGLDSDQLKTIRKVSRGDADSSTMLSASRIMQALIPSAGAQEAPQYGGMDAGRSTASTSGLAQQTPSPGEASQPKAPPPGMSPQLSGQGALPLPGQSPGLSKLPTTGETPIAATHGGKTFMQFAWEHALKGTKDLAAELKEAGRTAFEEPEKFDPRAPLKAAGMMVGGGTPFAARGALGAAGGKLMMPEKPGLVGLGAHPTTTPKRIFSETQKGGYSVHLPTGERPSEGLMMGVYSNKDPRNSVIIGRAMTQADVKAHGERNIMALQHPERFYGTWRDPATGNVYFDVSQRFPARDIRQATKFGERTRQLAGYDVGKGESFPVGNWKEFIKSPEFHARMHEMAGLGREYLSKYPTKEWWDMHGSSFERIYGTKDLPQVAGFTASTAPNTAPRENLQVMSEYMRRYIRRDPIIQPEWRTPEGLMSRAPGKQIGMEQSRAANLQKAAGGRLSELQRDKVRSEAQAMMGDPNAVVLDRHWARLGEAPERGIYTSTQEGVISAQARARGPSDYGIMENEVRDAARSIGRDPRDFSADAWTGIRDTIQRTGQLYGQKFKGASVRGESKSYADHLDDLVREKAKHMGMTASELEKRLRGGDASLLGIMLGAPTIAAAYRYWDAGQNAPASSAGSPATAGSL
jgi:hypothetical protein